MYVLLSDKKGQPILTKITYVRESSDGKGSAFDFAAAADHGLGGNSPLSHHIMGEDKKYSNMPVSLNHLRTYVEDCITHNRIPDFTDENLEKLKNGQVTDALPSPSNQTLRSPFVRVTSGVHTVLAEIANIAPVFMEDHSTKIDFTVAAATGGHCNLDVDSKDEYSQLRIPVQAVLKYLFTQQAQGKIPDFTLDALSPMMRPLPPKTPSFFSKIFD